MSMKSPKSPKKMASLSRVRSFGGHDSISITVRLLEADLSENIRVSSEATGRWFLDELCRRQDVLDECDFFGIRFVEHDLLSPPTKQWLDVSRNVHSQLKHTKPCVVSFRVKHYPADAMVDFKQAKSRYLLYHQLRRDLVSGRLAAPMEDLRKLAALIVHVELGDASMQDPPQLTSKDEVVTRTYLSDFKVMHNQLVNMELAVIEEHKKLEGLLPSEAAMEVIRFASNLETYGVDPIRVKTKYQGHRPVHLGLTHIGIVEFIGNKRDQSYAWATVEQMTYNGRHFIITCRQATHKSPKKKVLKSVNFKCESKAAAASIWKWAMDRRLFFTLEKSDAIKPIKAKGGLFSRSHTFTFSGRCRSEVMSRPNLAATLPFMSTGPGSPSATLPRDDLASISASELDVGTKMDSLSTAPDAGTDALSLGTSIASEPMLRRRPFSMLDPCVEETYEPIASVGELEVQPLQSCTISHSELAPFFTSMPRRKYAPEAERKAKYCIARLNRDSYLSGDTASDDATSEAAIEAINSAASECEAWAATSSPTKPEQIGQPVAFSSPRRWFSFGLTSNDIKPEKVANNTVKEVPSKSKHSAAVENGDDRPRSLWKVVAVSGVVLLGLSLVGIVLVWEADIHSQTLANVRENPLVMDLEASYYRPFRSALLGLWHS